MRQEKQVPATEHGNKQQNVGREKRRDGGMVDTRKKTSGQKGKEEEGERKRRERS